MTNLPASGAIASAPAKPPLKWAGGKRWLIPHLQQLKLDLQDHRLVEPFMGGLAVTLGLNPKRALLNDFNPHLVNFYRQLHDGLDITKEFKHDEAAYYQARDQFNQLIHDGKEATPEAAQLFYYLNRTCFNGLCRFNRKGEFNVPFGRYKTINYATTQDFQHYTNILSKWTFMDPGDFQRVPLEAADIVYADPPYDDAFTDYSKGGFDWTDQARLADYLAEAPGPVIASNHATPRILELYQTRGFVTHLVDAPRRINRTGDRTPRQEILAVKGLACKPNASSTCRACRLPIHS